VRPMAKRMFVLMLPLVMAGCAGSSTHTRAAPAAEVPPAPAAPAPKRDLLQEAGDATWRVVTTPARIFTPPKKEEQAPVTYEAPSITFSRRSFSDERVAPTATKPATADATEPGGRP
jgi:hypothetical protein